MKAIEPYLNLKDFFYTCVEGDSLAEIAVKFGVNLKKLAEDNRINCDVLPGDVLFVESLKEDNYRVTHLDTVDEICKKLNITRQMLVEKNGGENIYPCQILRV